MSLDIELLETMPYSVMDKGVSPMAYLSPDVVPVDNADGHAGHMPLLQQLADVFRILLGERAASYVLGLIIIRDGPLGLTPRRRGAQGAECKSS